MPNMWRLGGAGGVLFVATLIAGIVIQGGEPAFDDPIDEIRQEWIDEGQRFLLGDYVIALGFVLFYIPFMAALRELTGRAESAPAFWSRVGFIGALTTLLWAISSSAFWGALAFGDVAETASDETLRTLMALDYYANSGLTFGFLVFVAGTSVVIAQTRVLWRWLSILGAAVAVLSLVAPLAVLSDSSDSPLDIVWEFVFFGFLLWILCTGLAMLRFDGQANSQSQRDGRSA